MSNLSQTIVNLPFNMSGAELIEFCNEIGSPYFSDESMRFFGTRANTVHVLGRVGMGEYVFTQRSKISDDERANMIVRVTFTGEDDISADFTTLATVESKSEAIRYFRRNILRENAVVKFSEAGEYGNRCSLTVDGQRFVTDGCGYDMVGTVWGDYLTIRCADALRRIASENLSRPGAQITGTYVYFAGDSAVYGLHATLDDAGNVIAARVDGATGLANVVKFANTCGYILVATRYEAATHYSFRPMI